MFNQTEMLLAKPVVEGLNAFAADRHRRSEGEARWQFKNPDFSAPQAVILNRKTGTLIVAEDPLVTHHDLRNEEAAVRTADPKALVEGEWTTIKTVHAKPNGNGGHPVLYLRDAVSPLADPQVFQLEDTYDVYVIPESRLRESSTVAKP